MNTGRSRRTRVMMGRTNLSKSGSATFVNPVIAARKGKPVKPGTADSVDSSGAPKQATHFLTATASSGTGDVPTLARTRSELLERRRHSRAHFFDRYDLNGDGVVDPFEVRLGALVDVNNDGVIDDEEKEMLRDLIDQGKLKHMSILQDKRGGEAKKCMVHANTKEGRRVARVKAQERAAREKRMRERATKDKALKGVLGDLPPPEHASTTELLDTISSSMSPTKTLQRLLKPVFHKGAGPMDRVLTGRKTPTLKYEESPKHRTRSELMATRKALLKPSKTFDLDGDGDVDPLEHYIASMLDLDNNGSLDDEEKARAKELINALKKYYVVGLDRAGPTQAGQPLIRQVNGRVMQGVDEFHTDAAAADLARGSGPVYESHAQRAAREGLKSPDLSLGGSPRPTLAMPSPSRPSTRARAAAERSIWSPTLSRTGSRGSVLSHAASVSLADELKAARQASARDTPVRHGSGAEVLRLSTSRPATGMSRLVGM